MMVQLSRELNNPNHRKYKRLNRIFMPVLNNHKPFKYLNIQPCPHQKSYCSIRLQSKIKDQSTKSTENQDTLSAAKKVKEFKFQKIYSRQEKFKYAFSQQINYIIEKLFKGFNQAVFIYGTEEAKKDKILIGESQNPGFLLTTLSQMFQYCHEKEIQDQVTIKISCSVFKQGKFIDPFRMSNPSKNKQSKQKTENLNNTTEMKGQYENINSLNQNEEQQQTMLCEDMLQGKYLLGTPEIILRNMRTALKIINLLTKKISQGRESNHQQITQNIAFTIKLQIDTGYQKQSPGTVYEYSIPKLYIVKLGNPSINNTLNGVNKNNQWFINIFNFLQSEVLEGSGGRSGNNVGGNGKLDGRNSLGSDGNAVSGQQSQLAEIFSNNGTLLVQASEEKDRFLDYLKSAVMSQVADIHSFTSITNKMTSNECLTAFILNNYLSSFRSKAKQRVLNIYKIKNQKNNYEQQLLNFFKLRHTQLNKQRELMESYRVKYGILFGEWGNTQFLCNRNNLKDKNKQKEISLTLTLGKKNQKNSQSNPQLKKVNSKPQPASSIKQSLKQIFSLSCDNEGEIMSIQWQVKMFLLKYIESVKQFMTCCNIVEYEYAQVLSQGCQKLNKYIFNEEIEQFFYAKKISLQYSQDLKVALKVLKAQKVRIQQMEEKILKKFVQSIKSVNSQLEILKQLNARQEHEQLFKVKKNKLTTLMREKDIIVRLFQYYNTMSLHYIYEDNTKLIQQLQSSKKQIQEQFEKRNKIKDGVNYEQIMNNLKKGFSKRIEEKSKPNQNLEKSQNQISANDRDGSNTLPSDIERNMSMNDNKQDDRSLRNKRDGSLEKSKGKKNVIVTDKLEEIAQKVQTYKNRKKQDELDRMFTNSNVGVVRPHFHKRTN